MSTSKTLIRKAMSTEGNHPNRKTGTVFETVQKQILSGIGSNKNKYLVVGRDGKHYYRADFEFEGDIRGFLRLQSLVAGGKARISSFITFTSPDIGADAWAVPASKYVSHTWGEGGTTLLQAVEKAIERGGPDSNLKGVPCSESWDVSTSGLIPVFTLTFGHS
jgi:hypothetical protein